MNKLAFGALAGSALLPAAMAQGPPPRPAFPDDQSYVREWQFFNFTEDPHGPVRNGDGHLQRDLTNQDFSEKMQEFVGSGHHHELDFIRVGHWSDSSDHKLYSVEFYKNDTNHCHEGSTKGAAFPNPWAWLASAKYLGQRKVQSQTVDVWGYNDTDKQTVHEVSVRTDNANIPLFTADERYGPEGRPIDRFEERIHNFSTTIDPKHFEKPPMCQ